MEPLATSRRWFVYIARCGDGTLYTGITTDPERRRAEHASGKGAAYTRGRGRIRLVHVEEAPSKGAALSREYAIKQLTRPQKLELISSSVAAPGRRSARAPKRG